ncbi:MAG: hypothetical protein MZV63_64395 [Marinilabiliales bacterium]|nr:hypothetical protein [Marinilabiliales bacterium]
MYVKFLPVPRQRPGLPPRVNAMLALNDLRTLRSKMDLDQPATARRSPSGSQQAPARSSRSTTSGCPDHPLHALAKKYMKLVDSRRRRTGSEVNRYGHLMCVPRRRRRRPTPARSSTASR